jgi:tRNA-specific 2-thiouridylase
MPGQIVAAALSGGIDSAVAAMLLLERGYSVFGMTLHLWQEPLQDDECSSKVLHDSSASARQVAEALNIPLQVLDAALPFKDLVVDRLIAEYSVGRTPNPCLYCNRHIKFGYLLEHALAMGAERMATGHYARVRRGERSGTWELLRGVDPQKDQSYFLYMLGQQELSRTLFPLGESTKDEVRALARAHHLPIAGASESQDLCFVRDNDYRRFLREYAPQALVPGPILDSRGKELGRHRGLAEYTVGQRSGIGIAAPEALYVLHLDTQRNALIVGPKRELGCDHLIADQVRWVNRRPPTSAIQVSVQIRYRARPTRATVTPLPDARVRVALGKPLRDVTPGQAIVFYCDRHVLGGGLITNEW